MHVNSPTVASQTMQQDAADLDFSYQDNMFAPDLNSVRLNKFAEKSGLVTVKSTIAMNMLKLQISVCKEIARTAGG